MCPNGVEWKCITEIADTFIGLATSVTKYKVSEGILLLHNSDIKEDKIDLKTIEFVDSDFVNKNYSKILHTDDVITVHTGDVGTSAVITSEYDGTIGFTTISSRIKDKKIISPAFLCKILNSRICKDVIAAKTISDRNNLNLSSFDELKIPVPPLAIQTRIVEIIDHFTNLTANLTAELNLRRKQFEHYREKLLSLDGVEMVKLFDVAKNSTGLTYKPSDVSDSGTLVLRSSNIQNSMLCFDDNVFVKMKSIPTRALVKENDILVCVRNGSSTLIGKAAIIDKSCEGMAFGAFMTILRAFNINYKYLFYVWQSDRIQKMVHGDSGAPNAVLDKIMIPYPSEDTQHSIVSILDKFTALIENIEKELALRQKQYEYYREELLRFGG